MRTYPPSRPLDATRQIPVTGYFDRISGRPGERLALKVSCAEQGDYEARMVRILSADPNPDGPGIQLETVEGGLAGSFAGVRQAINIGSYATVPDFTVSDAPRAVFSVNVQPWLLRDTPSVIAASGRLDEQGWQLELSVSELVFRVGGQGCRVTLPARLKRKHWYVVWCGWDNATRRLVIGCRGIDGPERAADRAADGSVTAPLGEAAPVFAGALRFAATMEGGLSTSHFNGRLEDPMVHAAWWDEAPDERTEARSGRLLAWWDFSLGIETQRIMDVGSGAHHGSLTNCPTRAVRGSRWRGEVMKWSEAPRDYAAIHFHEDDLYDCDWKISHDFEIPAEAESGLYGIRLEKDGHWDIVPFYILPSRDRPARKIAFLASTFTYQCYANMARGNYDAAMAERIASWGAYAWNPDNFETYGYSVYNLHPDGSGICFTSRHRPMMNWRPGFLTFVDPKGSGIRHLSADTHLLHWLRLKGFEVDIVTDEDLDNEGPELIAGYATVLTGSHPEYHTSGTLDAISAHLQRGGNFCYLGGNGFYWRVERSALLPGMLEMRRAESGMRTWSTAPGEAYHQLKPTQGGLWRRNGRAPQRIAGVGFTAQGGFEGSRYEVNPDARGSASGWILDGVDEERLGDYGLNGGGAAGFELDRADTELGTPENAVVLASSVGHGPSFVCVPEDILAFDITETGADYNRLIRSDIVHYTTPAGGQVFSTGSILFCGSLLHANGENGISRMFENVLRRFS